MELLQTGHFVPVTRPGLLHAAQSRAFALSRRP
jgi:hypothetical protein